VHGRREARTSIILVSFLIIYIDWNLEVGTLGFVEFYAVNSVTCCRISVSGPGPRMLIGHASEFYSRLIL